MSFTEALPYCIGGIATIASVVLAIYMKRNNDKKGEKQKEAERRHAYPSNTVILHQFSRAPFAPSFSPFILKLETYLRMAEIPYQNEHRMLFSSKGKVPWITYNGEDVADSQVCIEFLNKKFDVDLNKKLSKEEKAASWAFQIMLEDHFFWAMALERLIYNEDNWAFLKLSRDFSTEILAKYSQIYKENSYAHGIGRHSKEQVRSLAINDLEQLSTYLGDKAFFMGEEPCEVDCIVFGIVVQVKWQIPGTILDETLHARWKNLEDYCERMKKRFWPDWNECNTAGGTKEATA